MRRVDQPRGQVVGDGRLEAHVEVRRHGDAGEDEDDRQRALQARAAPGGAHALDERAAAERQREQDERGAQREREADGDRARRARADRDDGGEDRPRARRVDEAQRGADEQARGESVAALRGPRRDRRASGASRRAASGGTARTTPKPMSTTTASVRVRPGPSPTPSMTLASPTIVTVKVAARPSAMPTGRRRPPVAPALSSAGRTGSTHGLSAVPAPARSAKTTVRESPVAPNVASLGRRDIGA